MSRVSSSSHLMSETTKNLEISSLKKELGAKDAEMTSMSHFLQVQNVKLKSARRDEEVLQVLHGRLLTANNVKVDSSVSNGSYLNATAGVSSMSDASSCMGVQSSAASFTAATPIESQSSHDEVRKKLEVTEFQLVKEIALRQTYQAEVPAILCCPVACACGLYLYALRAIYTRTQTRMHTCIHTHMCTCYIDVCIHEDSSSYTHTYICIHIDNMYVHICVCVCVYVIHTHIRIHTYTSTYIYAYIYVYI